MHLGWSSRPKQVSCFSIWRGREGKSARLRTFKVRAVMDIEKTITEIEWLENIFRLPDKRPLQMSDWKAANQKHDETYANNPWFRLWRRDGGGKP